jgi:hypothetical protein
MPVLIYVASKARPAEIALWTALRGAALPIAAGWIDSPLNGSGAEPTPDAGARHWVTCLEQAAAAEVTIFYAPEGPTQCGALSEIGSALQAGREVWIVSDYQWTGAHHPQCRVFKTSSHASRPPSHGSRANACATKCSLGHRRRWYEARLARGGFFADTLRTRTPCSKQSWSALELTMEQERLI